MYGNRHSGFGKSSSEKTMSTKALSDAITWSAKLMDREFMGRGDREKSIRGRLADKMGVPERYLYRLRYQAREMRDVAGEAYRRIKLYYEMVCENNEEAARQYRAERLGLRGHHETAGEKLGEQVVGTPAGRDLSPSPAEEVEA